MFGEVGHHGITRVGKTVWARLMESQTCCLPASSVGGGFIKETIACASTSIWEKAARPPQFSLWCQTIQVLQVCLWCLSSCCPSAEAQREWVWVSFSVHPLRGTAWNSSNLHIPQPQSLLLFTPRSYRDFCLEPWTGEPSVGSGPLFLRGEPLQWR